MSVNEKETLYFYEKYTGKRFINFIMKVQNCVVGSTFIRGVGTLSLCTPYIYVGINFIGNCGR